MSSELCVASSVFCCSQFSALRSLKPMPKPAFPWNRRSAPLPTERAFVTHPEDLDALSAWKHFGELSLDQAYEKFLTNPIHYQGSYMFMGLNAFDYYFPVIDRYLRTVQYVDESDDCEADILGWCVIAQFDGNSTIISDRLCMEISDLADFVRSNLGRLSSNSKGQKRIDKSWRQVQNKVAKHRCNK